MRSPRPIRTAALHTTGPAARVTTLTAAAVLAATMGCGATPAATPDAGARADTGAAADVGTGPRVHTFPSRDFGCSAVASSCATDAPVLSTAARTVTLDRAMADTTRAYVVDQITLPLAETTADRSRAAGFNLDAADARTPNDTVMDCTRRDADFVSLSDEGAVGVDNALQRFIPTIEGLLPDCPGGMARGCLDAALRTQINTGNLVLLLEVSGINSYAHDDAVSVQILLGEPTVPGAPVLGANGRIPSGRAYRAARSPDGMPILLGPAYTGDIFRGRLRIYTNQLTLSINTGTRQLDLALANAEVRFNISEAALTNGMIGGAVRNADIIGAATMVAPTFESVVRVVVEGAADIGPIAGTPANCGMVSVGIAFEGTSAALTR